MKNLIPFLLLILLVASAYAQQKEEILSGKVAKRGILYARSITTDDLKKHLYVLAADSLEGRDTGSKGLQKAASYISNHFQSIGLQPIVEGQRNKSYFQPFELEKRTIEEGFIVLNGKKYQHLQDIIFWEGAIEETQREVVFVGLGGEADYTGKDVHSKAVLVLNNQKHNFREVAQSKGVEVLLAVNIDTTYSVRKLLMLHKNDINKPSMNLPTDKSMVRARISEELAAAILGVDKGEFVKLMGKDSTATLSSLKNASPVSITINSKQRVEKVPTENVLGYIEGSDKKEEVVVITAHYDHIGIGTPVKGDSIYNGADDDASGTSAVMELAQAFAKAKQKGDGPRRSLLFIAFSAEEKGLLGSTYYVNLPVFPLQNTVTNLNIDMIGRIDSAHLGKPDYVSIVGSNRYSNELHQLNEAVNAQYTKLDFDYKHNALDDPDRWYERSDQYNFGKNGIPVIFFSTEDHADYHKPSDSADKIEYETMKKRTQMIFHLAWELANREKRVKLDAEPMSNK